MTEASIVFRNADMSTTPKIYVDKMSAALELASEFRNASTYVDIITRQDEVAYRWKDGVVEWDQGGRAAQASEAEPYEFERTGNPLWCSKARLYLLYYAIDYAADVIEGRDNSSLVEKFIQIEDEHRLETWTLVKEAYFLASQGALGTQGASSCLSALSCSAKNTILRHWVEHIALCIYTDLWLPETGVLRRRLSGA